jgi:hypothetical protein
MLRIRSRIERLEEAILPLPDEPLEFMHVQFVDSERKVVDTMTFEMAPVRPSGRRWLTAQGWPRAKGGW